MIIQQFKKNFATAGFALMLLTGNVQAADKPPAELRPLIPAGTILLDYRSEDMNGDGRKDFVFVVEKQATPVRKDDDEEGERSLLIAVRQTDDSLKVVKRNSRVVFCKQCGGVFGDPFEGLNAKPKSFSISHYGGSSWRWLNTFAFAYSRKDDSWQLVQVDESSFHASDPEKMKSKTYKPPRDFGKIDIADFDPEKFKGVGPK